MAAPDEAKGLPDVVHEPLELGAHDEIAHRCTGLVPGAILWPPLLLLVLPLLTEPWGPHVTTRTLPARWHTAPAAPAEARRLVNSKGEEHRSALGEQCAETPMHTVPKRCMRFACSLKYYLQHKRLGTRLHSWLAEVCLRSRWFKQRAAHPWCGCWGLVVV